MAGIMTPLTHQSGFDDVAARNTPQKPLLGDLSPEITLIIFEKLSEDPKFGFNPQSFLPLQLVSQKFNTIVTPFRYRSLTVDQSLLKHINNPCHQIAKLNIHLHTRHFALYDEVDWIQATQLLDGCQRLETIRWMLQKPMPQSLSRLISQKQPRVSLIVDRYLCPLEAEDEAQLASSYPAANIMSIVFVAAFSTNVSGLHSLLRAASSIKSITMTSQRGRFNPASGPLPPVRHFSVPVDRWRMDREDVIRLLDFSQLEYLEMRDLDSFLRTVQPNYFPRLRMFKGSRYDHRVRPSTYDRHQEKTALMLNQFLSALPLLESIDVSTMLGRFDISSLNNKPALRSLRLCDISESYQNRLLGEFVRPDAPSWTRRRPRDPHISTAARQMFTVFTTTDFPALSSVDIARIREYCPSVEELDLGIDRTNGDHLQLLQGISAFPRLLSLTLRTQTLGCELDEPNKCHDLDIAFVKTAWKILRTPEKHLPLAKLKVEISQLVYLIKAERKPEHLDWEALEASGHPRLATRTFNISWEHEYPKEWIPEWR
ncbi:hypothetical protein BKA64DRAFT_637481 [Cadophora sp. MPI-SDFR-AT-0126]|nr:hypothetical protein BKA64DRAFT_637481 [Leotiomycetes sp. MPI-SDFR-AT-0126]